MFGLIGVVKMGKTCAFFGNDYDFMHGWKRERRPKPELKEKIKTQIINLIENENVDTFLVGELGGFESDAYDTVLEVHKIYPHICITLVVAKISELQDLGVDASGMIHYRKFCHKWIYPDECAVRHKRWCIVYRNRYIIENTDFIIAYNEYKRRAYGFCKAAERKGVRVIELSDR